MYPKACKNLICFGENWGMRLFIRNGPLQSNEFTIDISVGCLQCNTKPCIIIILNTNLTFLVFTFVSNPIYTFDFFYKRSKGGRKFMKDCDFVHRIADEVILKRRQEIVSQSAFVNYYVNSI